MRDMLSPLVQPMLAVLGQLLSSGDEEEARGVLEMFIVVGAGGGGGGGAGHSKHTGGSEWVRVGGVFGWVLVRACHRVAMYG